MYTFPVKIYFLWKILENVDLIFKKIPSEAEQRFLIKIIYFWKFSKMLFEKVSPTENEQLSYFDQRTVFLEFEFRIWKQKNMKEFWSAYPGEMWTLYNLSEYCFNSV